MVTSQASVHLLALLVCCSFVSQPSDGAKLYGQPRHLDYEAILDDSQTPEGGYAWGAQEVEGGEGGMLGGGSSGLYLPPASLIAGEVGNAPLPPARDERPPLSFSNLDQLRALLLSAQTRSRQPGRSYFLTSPQHDAGPGGSEWPWREEEPKQKEQMEQREDEDEEEEQKEEEEEEAEQRRQIQLYMAYRRPPAPPTSRGAGGAGERGVKVEQKRWWGGRRQGQVDRRASQTKHYDCLKSCIKEGKLHPIQCHTLC